MKIKGETEAKSGDNIELECETANSNPAASIQWFVNGAEKPADETSNVSSSVLISVNYKVLTLRNKSNVKTK